MANVHRAFKLAHEGGGNPAEIHASSHLHAEGVSSFPPRPLMIVLQKWKPSVVLPATTMTTAHHWRRLHLPRIQERAGGGTLCVLTPFPQSPPPSCARASQRWIFTALRRHLGYTTSLVCKCELEVGFCGHFCLLPHMQVPAGGGSLRDSDACKSELGDLLLFWRCSWSFHLPRMQEWPGGEFLAFWRCSCLLHPRCGPIDWLMYKIWWLLYDYCMIFAWLPKWPLNDCCTTVQVIKSDNWMLGNVSNQGDFKLTALANLLTSCMTFNDLSLTNVRLWRLCMTNVKCVILLRLTQKTLFVILTNPGSPAYTLVYSVFWVVGFVPYTLIMYGGPNPSLKAWG